MLGNIGGGEIIVIVLVILLLFGPKKLTEMAKDLGKTFAKFQKSIKDVKDEIKDTMNDIK